ncbi:spore germination protein [Paenibacillus sp. GCM10027628]|uniref:spore germination protein n=1 Tax=Paenibacillus sp. GCM10027628 TaxID=3273413 RepID=UPI00362DB7A6
MAFIKQRWKAKKQPDTRTVSLENMNELLAADTSSMIQQIKQIFVTDDLEIAHFEQNGAATLFLNTLIETERLQQDIVPRIRPWLDTSPLSWELFFPQATLVSTLAELIDSILLGCVILIRDDLPGKAIAAPKRIEKGRSIEPPQLEKVLLGPQESFVEDFDTNASLLRKRVKDPNLVFHFFKIGQRSRTKVAVVFIKDIAKPEWVEEIETNLNKINIDRVSTHKELMELIVGENHTVFPVYELTELPVRSAINLTLGRIGLLMEGSPFVAFLPTTLLSSFLGSEFVYQGTLIPTFVRFIRMLAFVVALYAPAVYLALVSVNSSVMPTEFAISIAKDQEGIPYLSFFETFVMMLVMDILNEAMAFVPGNVGSALNVVGSLIIGDAAAKAGLVSKFMIIIAALSSIGAFIASYQVSYAVRLWKYPMLIAAGFFGFYGISIMTLVILGHLCAKKSLGVSYLSPISPFNYKEVRSFIVEPDMSAQNVRGDTFQPQNKIRQRGDPDQ